MKNLYLPVLLLLFGLPVWGQQAYTTPVFDVREEPDIYIGDAIDFEGTDIPVTIDMYKPVGDENCLRPLLLMIHGGAWVAGTRKDPEVVAISRQMAAMGYTVASLEYRLGHHKSDFYTQYAACLTDGCVYVVDTSEIYRAVFRGVQDAWSALRYLSGRHHLDSTDMKNVFVGGVSAGGFVALQTLLWEEPDDRPKDCVELNDVPAPDPELERCYVDPEYRKRPDLGNAKDGLWTQYEAPVIRGMANFYGGIFKAEQLEILRGKPLYIFHQTNDLIVDCGKGKLLGPIYRHCLNPLNLCDRDIRMPIALGSCAIITENRTRDLGIVIFEDILENGPPNGLTCLANPPTHSIINIPRRCTNMATHFAPWIAMTGNDPDSNCLRLTGITVPNDPDKYRPACFPNPTSDYLNFTGLGPGNWTVKIYALDGRQLGIWTIEGGEKGQQGSIHISAMPAGIAIVHLSDGRRHFNYRIAILD